MKITIELDSEKEDQTTINAHLDGPDLALCIWEIQNEIRAILKSEECTGEIETKINRLYEIIYDSIGSIDRYTS